MAAGVETSTSAASDTAAGAASGVTEAACKSGVSIMKAAMVIIYVITWGVQLCKSSFFEIFCGSNVSWLNVSN